MTATPRRGRFRGRQGPTPGRPLRARSSCPPPPQAPASRLRPPF